MPLDRQSPKEGSSIINNDLVGGVNPLVVKLPFTYS